MYVLQTLMKMNNMYITYRGGNDSLLPCVYVLVYLQHTTLSFKKGIFFNFPPG
jgi:hypothetical protein